MRTIVAIYDEADDAWDAVREIDKAGIDHHYIKLMTCDANGRPVAYLGPEDAGTGDSVWEQPVAYRGEQLEKILRVDFGDDEADGYLDDINDGDTIVVVHVERYQEDAVRELLDKDGLVSLSIGEVAYHQQGRPHPGPSGYTPPPKTEDFYSNEGMYEEEPTYERGLEYETVRSRFYTHYNANYAATSLPFDRYAPAYQFGWRLHREKRPGDAWSAVAPSARLQWEETHPQGAAWEDVRDAIKYAWETGGE